jgi:hypothetical protein
LSYFSIHRVSDRFFILPVFSITSNFKISQGILFWIILSKSLVNVTFFPSTERIVSSDLSQDFSALDHDNIESFPGKIYAQYVCLISKF